MRVEFIFDDENVEMGRAIYDYPFCPLKDDIVFYDNVAYRIAQITWVLKEKTSLQVLCRKVKQD